MTDRGQPSNAAGDVTRAMRLDQVCDSFEEHRKAGGSDGVGRFLEDVAVEDRESLFALLLKVECELAARTGRFLPIEELRGEFSEWSGVLDRVVEDHDRFAAVEDPASLTPVLAPGRVFQDLRDSKLVPSEEVDGWEREWFSRRETADSMALTLWLVSRGGLSEYQAEELVRGRGAKLVLGNYEVLRPLGSGGMGQVFLARHQVMRRTVAVKILHARTLSSDSGARRFRQEVITIARLVHPRIVTAHDADTIDGVRFLVMEYVAGTDLSTKVRRDGPLELDQAIDCVLQVADALEYAHSHAVVHRDIKPANLVWGEDGQVKLLDLGLANTMGESQLEDGGDGTLGEPAGDSRLTMVNVMLGTPHFVAPEQAANARQADHRVDVYSLGATFCYLLSGRTMFSVDSAAAQVRLHQGPDRPSLSELCEGVPSSVVEIFDRMTAVDPADRYPSMAKLARALESCRRGLTAKERGLHIVKPARDVDRATYDSTQFTRSFETHSGRQLDDSLTDSEPEPSTEPPPDRRRLVRVAVAVAVMALLGAGLVVAQFLGGIELFELFD